MRSRITPLWILPLLLLIGIAAWVFISGRAPAENTYTVTLSRFERWHPLSGQLEAKNAVSLRSELDGLSKITWLIEDGTPVFQGDTVARFDPSELEDKKLTLARDLEMASAELRSLSLAQHPLELQRLQSDLRNLEAQYQEQSSLRKDTEELVKENLLSAEELNRHDLKLQELQSDIDGLKQQVKLTEEILHPALEQKAEARLNAAKSALARVEERLKNTEVVAQVQGTVYLPRIPIDSERRAPRVGDGLYRNQVFMQLADLTELEVQSQIPEQSLSKIVPGLNARIHFPAYPEKVYTALVSRVGAHPEGETQRYPVTLVLQETGPELRPGLTAEIEVLEYINEQAILIPRAWISYRDGVATVRCQSKRGSTEIRELKLGDGNPEFVVVNEGLAVGELLIQP